MSTRDVSLKKTRAKTLGALMVAAQAQLPWSGVELARHRLSSDTPAGALIV